MSRGKLMQEQRSAPGDTFRGSVDDHTDAMFTVYVCCRVRCMNNMNSMLTHFIFDLGEVEG